MRTLEISNTLNMSNLKEANVILTSKNQAGYDFIFENGSLYNIKSFILGKHKTFLVSIMSNETGELKLVNIEKDKNFIVKFM